MIGIVLKGELEKIMSNESNFGKLFVDSLCEIDNENGFDVMDEFIKNITGYDLFELMTKIDKITTE